MSDYKSTLAVLAIGCAVLIAPIHATALDIGGKNGVSVSGNSGSLNASVGGPNGVNASVGRSSKGGLGANASIGGSPGINSTTSVGRRDSGLDVNTTARIGGSNVNADVDASLGGSRLATATARLGASEDAVVEPTLGTLSGNAGTTGVGADSIPRSTIMALNEMSAVDKAKAKLLCKDVLSSGGFDASLVKLCKMVVAMR
ncbi:hypothetical protein EV128_1269 [Rhizobium azibense]|nr:hypothetical protein EV128_1269 [Rhizobium azibense]